MKDYLTPEIEFVYYEIADVLDDSTEAVYETNGVDNADGSANGWVYEELI